MTTQQDTGTTLVPTEVDALRRAALHSFKEALRWAVDQIDLEADGRADVLVGEIELAIRSYDRAGYLLDQVGWQPEGDSVVVNESDEYLSALCVLALEYDASERRFLSRNDAETLDSMTANRPTLDENEAWHVVFTGES